MRGARVVIAEDHALVRAGLRSLLQRLDAEVVAEAATGREALDAVAEHEPDVVVMDLSMPEMNGLEATARIAGDHPEVRILVLSMHDDPEYVGRALREGASGYLLKDSREEELEVALRSVARGRTYLSPAISGPVVEGYLDTVPVPDAFERLTPRQREVLQLLAEGHSTREIADKLYISVKTVESHRAHIQERLDIHNVPDLVRYAIRSGIASLDG